MYFWTASFLGAVVYLLSFFTIAAVIRADFFEAAFKILLKHEFRDDDAVMNFGWKFPMDSNDLPFWKGFEFIGEAIPQLILAITFIANNHEFMLQNVTVFGIPEFYITLISMIFSVGSIAMGLNSAISADMNNTLYASFRIYLKSKFRYVFRSIFSCIL